MRWLDPEKGVEPRQLRDIVKRDAKRRKKKEDVDQVQGFRLGVSMRMIPRQDENIARCDRMTFLPDKMHARPSCNEDQFREGVAVADCRFLGFDAEYPQGKLPGKELTGQRWNLGHGHPPENGGIVLVSCRRIKENLSTGRWMGRGSRWRRGMARTFVLMEVGNRWIRRWCATAWDHDQGGAWMLNPPPPFPCKYAVSLKKRVDNPAEALMIPV